jgi:hypothetical protein
MLIWVAFGHISTAILAKTPSKKRATKIIARIKT